MTSQQQHPSDEKQNVKQKKKKPKETKAQKAARYQKYKHQQKEWRIKNAQRITILNRLSALKRKWELRSRISRKKLQDLNELRVCPICGAVESVDKFGVPTLGYEFVDMGNSVRICRKCYSAIEVLGNVNADYLLSVAALVKMARGEYTHDYKPFPDIKDKYDCIKDYYLSPDYHDETVQTLRTVEDYRRLSPSSPYV